jgi:acetylornithine deacetylase/succinyl-diaminopimelate desuccinylase-like protein
MKNHIDALIGTPSVSGSEKKCIGYIKQTLDTLHVKFWSVSGNVVAYIPGKNTHSAVIFDMHVDTVHPGTLAQWKTNPYQAVHRNGKVYGLGASDEKSAVATVLLLVQPYTKKQPACDVYFFFVTKEEIDGSGSQCLVSWFMKKKKKQYAHVGAVLGEPTDLKTIEIAHKGNIFIKVTTRGDSGHGACPEKISVHAVQEMMRASTAMQKLGIRWGKKYADSMLGKPSIGLLTSITAGTIQAPNVFPGTCIATFDIRTTPALHVHAVQEIKECLHGLTTVSLVNTPGGCGYTNPADPLVQIAKTVVPKAKICASDWSSDLCFFTKAHIPAIVFGPGTKACMHKPNEYCIEKNIAQCVIYYDKIIEHYAEK